MRVFVLILFSLVAGGLSGIVPKDISSEGNTVQTDVASSGEDKIETWALTNTTSSDEDSKETWLDFWNQFFDNIDNVLKDIWDQFSDNDIDSFEPETITWTNYWDTVLGDDADSYESTWMDNINYRNLFRGKDEGSIEESEESYWKDLMSYLLEKFGTVRNLGWLYEMDEFLGKIAYIYNSIKGEIYYRKIAPCTTNVMSRWRNMMSGNQNNVEIVTSIIECFLGDDTEEEFEDQTEPNFEEENTNSELPEWDDSSENISKHSFRKTAQQFGVRLLKCFSEPAPEGDSNDYEEHPIPRKCMKEQMKAFLKYLT